MLAQSAIDYLKQWLTFAAEHRARIIWVVSILAGLLVLTRLWRGVSRAIRRRRPPTIHPALQKYSIDHAALDRERQRQAAAIIATSTGSRLTGFRIIRQVEAVFVEGFRTPEEALTALKAAAVKRGANAVLNVRTERSMAGRCTASGDAVLVSAIPNRPLPHSPQNSDLPPPPQS